MTPDEVKAVAAMVTADGGRAFPLESIQDGNQFVAWGMSMRDYFAGQALAGMLANGSKADSPRNMAEFAFRCADAMLAERK